MATRKERRRAREERRAMEAEGKPESFRLTKGDRPRLSRHLLKVFGVMMILGPCKVVKSAVKTWTKDGDASGLEFKDWGFGLLVFVLGLLGLLAVLRFGPGGDSGDEGGPADASPSEN